MADISKEIERIKHAVYGEDVRQSIADALNKVNTDNYTELRDDVDSLKDEIADKIEASDIFGEVSSETIVLDPTWASGFISPSNGDYNSSASGGNYYACTTTFLSSNETITLNIHDGVAYRYFWYSKDDDSYVSGISLKKTTGERTVTLDNTYKYRVELISYDGTSVDGTAEATNSIIDSIGTYIGISYSTIVRHDGIVTKASLEEIGFKAIGGKLVSDIGKTYKIDSFSTTGNVYADFQSNIVKESKKALRICVRGVTAGSDSTVATRGAITLNFQTVTILDSLSIWCMIPSRYVLSNETRDLHNYTCTPTITYDFYNGNSLVYTMKEQPRNTMGWRCGWDFHKFVYNYNGNAVYNYFKKLTINKIVMTIETKNSSPDFEMYIDSIVVDRRLNPVFCYNVDDDFSDDATLELARYLYINRIPANVRIDFSTDISSIANIDLTTMTASEMRTAGITAKMVILKGYYEGLFDFNVYTNAAFNRPFVESKNWLKSGDTNSFALDNIEAAGANVGNNPIRPIICAANWQHKLDDTLKLAEEQVGFKAIRGYGRMTFFVDSIANVIATIPAGQNYNSVSELTNEWINNTASSIKQMIDNAVTYGSIYNLFSHKCYPVSSIVEVTSSPIIPFEVMKEVIDYVVTLRNSGVISTMTMDGVYNCSMN